jgi:hypothetical protein
MVSKTENLNLSRFLILVSCDACGHVHAVSFSNKNDFMQLTCATENEKIFRTKKAYEKVFAEFQNDLLEEAVAV